MVMYFIVAMAFETNLSQLSYTCFRVAILYVGVIFAIFDNTLCIVCVVIFVINEFDSILLFHHFISQTFIRTEMVGMENICGHTI